MKENSLMDKKSLRTLTKANPDWDELAKDCVCFTNAQGGFILYGIEDHDVLPPDGQKIPEDLPAKLQKQIQGRTINVSVVPQVKQAENGSEYLELLVQRNVTAIASTSNGRYYMRVDDDCKPILPDELSRLLADKGAFQWETQTYLKVSANDYDREKMTHFHALTAIEFANILGIDEKDAIRSWLGRLIDFKLITSKGRTKGTTYLVEPHVLKRLDFKGLTNLKNIEAHRLDALIVEDLTKFEKSSISEIQQRIGQEIPMRTIRYQLTQLIDKQKIKKEGEKKGTRYFIDK